MVGERGDVGVVVAQLRAERGEEGEDLQGGGLADVAYNCTTLNRRALRVIPCRLAISRGRSRTGMRALF